MRPAACGVAGKGNQETPWDGHRSGEVAVARSRAMTASQVVRLPGTICCWRPDRVVGTEPVAPVRHRPDGCLLVVTGRGNERDGDDGNHRCATRGTRLVHLHDAPPGPKP